MALAAVTVGVGMVAGWLAVARPPALDGERLFKLTLATLLLGETEAAGGDGSVWEKACRTWVPYHPAVQHPERLLTHPQRRPSDGAAREGELALREKLAARSGLEERLRYLYEEDEAGLEARMADPSALGDAWDLSRWVAHDLSWDTVAAWSEGDNRAGDALARAMDATWLCTEGGLAEALSGVVTVARVSAVDIRAVAEEQLASGVGRLVLVLEGEPGLAILDVLRLEPGLRDRIFAVVALGVPLWGVPDVEGSLSVTARRDWMEANFRHEILDTEAMRLTPYCALQWLDLADPVVGAGGLPLASARFGAPGGPTDAPRIESVDLGPVRVGTELGLLARALALTVAVLVLSKR